MGALAEDLSFSMDVPWRQLPERAKEALLTGRNHKVHVRYRNRYGRERSYSTGFEGVIPFVKRRHAETDSDWSRERYEGYMREVPCPVCRGARLKPESLAVLVGGRASPRSRRLSIAESARFLDTVDFTDRERQIAERVIKEINARLGFLLDVGLDYLSLDRPGRDPLRRRGPADPAGHPDRVRPRRRPLRPRRAEHRPAPARQPPAHRDPDPAARPRQHPHRRRARRGHHRHRRLGRRHRPGAGEHGGQVVHSGPVPRSAGAPRLDHRPVPVGTQGDPDPAGPSPAGPGPRRSRWSARGSTTSTTSPCPSRSAPSSPSPGCPARASRPSSTTSSTTSSPTSSTAPGRSPAGTSR